MSGKPKYQRASGGQHAGGGAGMAWWIKLVLLAAGGLLVLHLVTARSGESSATVAMEAGQEWADGGLEGGEDGVDAETEGLVDSSDPGTGEIQRREKFHIFVLGWRRFWSLERLLKSLDEADYMGDRIGLHIHIDGGEGTKWEKSIAVAKDFKWRFGSKVVKIGDKNRGLANAWLTAWNPAADDEYAVILEDDLVVSKHYYKYIMAMYRKYGDRPEIGGVTLQRGTLKATGGHKRVENINPWAYKLLGSWGYAPHPRWWREFLKLDLKHLDASVKGLITTKWYQRQRKRSGFAPKMWTQSWIWFCDQNNLYTIYLVPPKSMGIGNSMASNMKEPGVHFGHKGKPDAKPITTWLPEWDNLPDEIDLYGWNFAKSGVSRPPQN